MKIISIETSCDDTCAALVDFFKEKISVKSNIVSSQIDLHKKYGGVVPEVAARAHIKTIIPVIKEATKRKANSIEALAVTTGPGLITSLHVGVETAKALSLAWNIPLINVNHIEGHIYAPLINKSYRSLRFPAIALIVSGGHTELILMRDHGKYSLIGRTRDDAAGEAFDKSAKMMGLPYPGGPEISRLASSGDHGAFDIPRPMINDGQFEFSFSGMKNAIRLLIKNITYKNRTLDQQTINNLCASIELAIIDVLVDKSLKSIEKYHPKTFILSGGVGSNKKLRAAIKKSIPKNIRFLAPEPKFCMDNAAMIASAAYQKARKKQFTPYQKLSANANWELV